MKNQLKIISIVLITTIFSCSKDDSPQPETPVVANPITTVYVGGSQIINGFEKATIWKNGTPELLATEAANNSRVYSVCVVGNDVYAVGFEISSSGGIATLWKNGAKTALSQTSSIALSVAVKFNTVYIVGREGVKAAIWVSQTGLYDATIISNTNYSVASSVFLTDDGTTINGVHVAGQIGQNAWIFYNSGNNETIFTNNSTADSIFVRGNDVYVAVNNYFSGITTASLLKNQAVQNTIASGTAMLSVYGDDQNIYAAGAINPFTVDSRATIWENYVPKPLSTKYSEASSVFVINKVVYVTGYEYDSNTAYFNATLWVNGVVQTLSTNNCTAKSVFVTVK